MSYELHTGNTGQHITALSSKLVNTKQKFKGGGRSTSKRTHAAGSPLGLHTQTCEGISEAAQCHKLFHCNCSTHFLLIAITDTRAVSQQQFQQTQRLLQLNKLAKEAATECLATH